MCGIFGVLVKEKSRFTQPLLFSTINDLFVLSESRGKEAAGIAIYGPAKIEIYKTASPATKMIRSAEYKNLLAQTFGNGSFASGGTVSAPFAVIGHSRLVTNGSMQVHGNNQPVVSQGLVGIHNGIIVNDGELWRAFPALSRQYEVDTEVILNLLRYFYDATGDLLVAARSTFQRLRGTASVAILFDDLPALLLATNNGSLYVCSRVDGGAHLFASERYILSMLLRRTDLRERFDGGEIQQVRPGFGQVIGLSDLQAEMFSLTETSSRVRVQLAVGPTRPIVDATPVAQQQTQRLQAPSIIPDAIQRRFAVDTRPIKALRRCTSCILPETMPFIEFDEKGVCNYCREYEKIQVEGADALLNAVEPYRRKNGAPECLVTFSGGRDSSFGVHYAKNVLKLNTIAYTYDWGMVTDIARRNIARVCGQLGVEHILISADIRKKRENIRMNVSAWLKRPDLGTVPLFMAGDKQFFYYANKLRQQMEIDLVILCINPFERTNFKTGFCGVRQSSKSASIYALPLVNQFKLAAYYGRAFLLNPHYFNSSILDTLSAFYSFYNIPHDFLNIYRYLTWDERMINSTLIQEYNWEVAKDTNTTWRIGDGTAAFYNYIYYLMAGFTENDTFRSNQIREGMLTREEALRCVEVENEPRFDSIRWYCDTIGVDFEKALEAIYAAPRRYPPV